MPGVEALDLALGLLRAPARRGLLASRPLPAGMTTLLEVAGGSDSATHAASVATGASPDELREASRFFVQQVLFTPDADAYRVLGASADAPQSRLHTHHRLLQRWLHPDRDGGEAWDSAFSARVNQAWAQLRSPQLRSAYDAERSREGDAPAPAGPGWRRPPLEVPPGPSLPGAGRPQSASRLGPLAVIAAVLACILLIWLLHQRDLRARGDVAGPSAPGLAGAAPVGPADRQAATASDPAAAGVADMLAAVRLDAAAAQPAGPPAPAPTAAADATATLAAIAAAQASASASARPVAEPPGAGAQAAGQGDQRHPMAHPASRTSTDVPADISAAVSVPAAHAPTVPGAPAAAAVNRPAAAPGTPAVVAVDIPAGTLTGIDITADIAPVAPVAPIAPIAPLAPIAPVEPVEPIAVTPAVHSGAPPTVAQATSTAPVETAPLPSGAADPVHLMRQAEQTAGQVFAWLVSGEEPVRPLWADPAARADATGTRSGLHQRGHGGGRFVLDNRHWRMGQQHASLDAGYSAVGQGGAGEAGRIRIEMARRDQQWLVTSLQLEPGR